MILQIHEWLKDTFKVQERLINFNITKHEKFNGMVSGSTMTLILTKLLL